MKKLILAAVIPAALLYTSTAFADGYLFKLKDSTVVPYSDTENIECVPLSYETLYKADTVEEIYEFAGEKNVEEIFENIDFEMLDAPNDPFFAQQWNLECTDFLHAYEYGLNGKGVKIGIIDSGINVSHEDINSEKVILTYNVLDKSENAEDEFGHGTFVTSIIAADCNNGIGLSGAADKAELCLYKVFDQKTTKLEYILQALDRAITDGCDVINMSLGAEIDSENQKEIDIIQELIDRAISKNIIVVCAAGNSGNNKLNYPASCDGAIGVASVNKDKKRSTFSNYNKSVFVTAPGEYLTGAWIGEANSYAPAGGVYTGNLNYRGTSYSAPLVTAMAAMAKQIDGGIGSEMFKELLKASSEDLGVDGYDVYYGWGMVNIASFTDRLIPFHIMKNEEGSSLSVHNSKSGVSLYRVGYSGGLVSRVEAAEIPVGISEINPEPFSDCTNTELFFWQGMTPVWNKIEVNKKE